MVVAEVFLLLVAASTHHASALTFRGGFKPFELTKVGTPSAYLPLEDVVNFTMHKCDSPLRMSLCDPEHLLMEQTQRLGAQDLRALSNASESGMSAQLVVLKLPGRMTRKTLQAAADSLGAREGRNNTVVGVFSLRDDLFALSSGTHLFTAEVSREMQWRVEHAGMAFTRPTADDAAVMFIAQVQKAMGPMLPMGALSTVSPAWLPHVSLEKSVELVACSASAILVAVASLLLLCFTCDIWSRWRQVQRFRACLWKVQRVHEAVVNPHGEPHLCLCCVDTLKSESTSSVVFLCGHRFHIQCVNAWFAHQPATRGKCPVCEEQARLSSWCLQCHEAEAEDDAAVEEGDSENDHRQQPLADPDQGETKLFVLQSLRQQYPEIIPEQKIKKWATCHTELWLSELACPPRRLSSCSALAAYMRVRL